MQSVVMDTHAAIWYLTNPEMLSGPALQAIEDSLATPNPIFISAISLVEIIYLTEKYRIAPAVLERINSALNEPFPSLEIIPLDLTIARTLATIQRDVVPDMPDRIIAATALAMKMPLVSRDRKIQATSIQTIW